MQRPLFLILFLVLSGLSSSAQIVNIESLRSAADSNGLYGAENFNVAYTKNTRELFELKNNLVAQYRHNRHIWLFLNTWDLSLAAGQTLEQNVLFHLRYNFKQNDWLTYEVLAQYQQNQPLRISDRILMGAGPRYTLLKKKDVAKVYLGTLVMYEYDDELNNDIIHQDVRLSAYLSTYLTKKDKFEWSTTVYYQPRIDYWEDYRTSVQTQLKFGLLEKLFYVTTLSMTYDSFPVVAPEIPNLTLKWVNGIELRF